MNPKITLDSQPYDGLNYYVPREIVDAPLYKKLSKKAVFAYTYIRGIFVEHLLKISNGDTKNFLDEYLLNLKTGGEHFIIREDEELSISLHFSIPEVIEVKNELKKYGLIKEVLRGSGLPNLIYVYDIDNRPEVLQMTFEEAKSKGLV